MTPSTAERQCFEHGAAIGIAQGLAARALGVGHHAKDIALCVADASNVVHRTIGVEIVSDPPSGPQ